MRPGAKGESANDVGIMRRNVAASMNPAPRPTKYFRNISFQWRRATTTRPPMTLAAAAAAPKARLSASGDESVVGGADDSTRGGGGSNARVCSPGSAACAPARARSDAELPPPLPRLLQRD